MRRHNCTIIDDRFIRRPDRGLEVSSAWSPRTEDTGSAMVAYYYKEKSGLFLHRVGMSGWSEMTITEDPC